MPFGFEFELLIPVFSKTSDGLTVPPDYQRIDKPRAPGETIQSPKIGSAPDGSFVVSIEHQDRLNMHKSKRWPDGEHMTSMEIATSAMDETKLSRQAVEQAMQGISTWALQLEVAVTGRDRAHPQQAAVAHGAQLIDGYAVPEKRNVNFAGPSPERNDDGVVSADAYVQETYGLRLDRVAQEFTERAKSVPPLLQSTTDWYQHLLMSGSTIPNAPATIALNLFGDLGSSHAPDELRGLLMLIRYYAAMRHSSSKKTQKVIGKNSVGVFYYKTQLSTVCRELGLKYPPIATFLGVTENRLAVGKALGVPGPFQGWVLEILAGVSDSFFLDTMNPWSEELFAPQLGPPGNQSVGVVVENRQFRVTYPPAKVDLGLDTTRMFPPGEWASIATRLYDRLNRMHNGS